MDIWDSEKDDPILGPLSVRMGVRKDPRSPLNMSSEEVDAASVYTTVVATDVRLTFPDPRFLPCVVLYQSLIRPNNIPVKGPYILNTQPAFQAYDNRQKSCVSYLC